MKFEAIKLIAFGPFTDRILDFSGERFGLHVLFGPNEAGKTTALRALTGLLYGFGHIVGDAWKHQPRDLAVGGVFVLSDGRTLNLTRFKRRKNDLIDDDTGEPVGQALLDEHLGRMGREAFTHAFGVSHESLRLGVESVLAAGGDLGHALFAATSGLNTLKLAMARLDEKMAELFTPRSRKALVITGISEIKRLRKAQKDASSSHIQWLKTKKQVDRLQQSEKTNELELEELSARIGSLSRHRDAVKHVAARARLEKELEKIGPAPRLRENFRQERVETRMGVEQAAQAEKHLKRDLGEIDNRLENLSVDERIVDNGKRIEALAGEANVHAKARVDAKSLRARIHQQRDSAKDALERLRPGLTSEDAEKLRLSRPEQSRIQRLASAGVKLEESRISAEKALKSAAANLEKLQRRLDAFEKPERPESADILEDAVSRASELGKIEDQLEKFENETLLLRGRIDADLAALGLWKGELSVLERLAIPTDETMREYGKRIENVERDLDDVRRELKKEEKKRADSQRRFDRMTRSRELPSLKDLHTHRTLRDKGWRSVRAAWLRGEDPDPEFMEAFASDGHLADLYEKSVERADRTSDILRQEAEAVAQADNLREEIREIDVELSAGKIRRDDLQGKRDKLWDQWRKLWSPLGVDPLPPAEMLEWSGRTKELKRKAEAFRKNEAEAEVVRKSMAAAASELASALSTANAKAPENAGFSTLLSLARRALTKLEKADRDRRNLEGSISALQAEIDGHRERSAEIELELSRWKEQWAAVVSRLGLEADAGHEDVLEFVSALEDVFRILEKAKDYQVRQDAISSDYEKYKAKVKAAADELAPELSASDPETVAFRLNDRLKKEQERLKERKTLELDKRKKAAELAKIQENKAALEERMRLLCLEGETDDPEALPDMEKRSADRIRVERDLAKVDERLEELSVGEDLDAFAERVKSCDPDELSAGIEALASKRKQLEQERKRIVAELALAGKELNAIGEESDASMIAVKAEGQIAKTQADVERYVKLRLGSAILAKAMERYRQTHQSPVLEAAGGYFKTITRNAFEGLRADYDEKGNPVIKAVRPDGALLEITELSDGSRDQLFLALRFGGLFNYVKNNGPMPLVVDDVLVHFDDERSAAALKAMADLARDTQIVFFTHHRHLIDVMKKALPDSPPNVQYL